MSRRLGPRRSWRRRSGTSGRPSWSRRRAGRPACRPSRCSRGRSASRPWSSCSRAASRPTRTRRPWRRSRCRARAPCAPSSRRRAAACRRARSPCGRRGSPPSGSARRSCRWPPRSPRRRRSSAARCRRSARRGGEHVVGVLVVALADQRAHGEEVAELARVQRLLGEPLLQVGDDVEPPELGERLRVDDVGRPVPVVGDEQHGLRAGDDGRTLELRGGGSRARASRSAAAAAARRALIGRSRGGS